MLNVINVNNKGSLTDEAYYNSHEIHPYYTHNFKFINR